jgi:hypothetical protein
LSAPPLLYGAMAAFSGAQRTAAPDSDIGEGCLRRGGSSRREST